MNGESNGSGAISNPVNRLSFTASHAARAHQRLQAELLGSNLSLRCVISVHFPVSLDLNAKLYYIGDLATEIDPSSITLKNYAP